MIIVALYRAAMLHTLFGQLLAKHAIWTRAATIGPGLERGVTLLTEKGWIRCVALPDSATPMVMKPIVGTPIIGVAESVRVLPEWGCLQPDILSNGGEPVLVHWRWRGIGPSGRSPARF